MVFFTCNGCGESMKKGQVEKHVAICRNSQCLSCIDCGKDFWGDDYTTHLKCVTEDEKYGGKGFSAKVAKGEVKQQQWIQSIQEAVKKPNMSDDVRKILMKVSTCDNIPRKKGKFQNWIKNSMNIDNQALTDKVWDIFADATSKQKDDDNKNNAPEPSNTPAAEIKPESSAATEETEQKKSKRERKEERQKKSKKEKKDLNSEEQQQNGTKRKGKKRKMKDDDGNESGDDEANNQEATGKKKKKKQREREDEDVSENEEEASKEKKINDPDGDVQEEAAEEDVADENGEGAVGKSGKFNWKGTIKALLRLAPDNELPIKKLRKKVIAQYYMVSSEQHKYEKDLFATFNKKILSNPKFRVLKERVKLVK